MDNKQYKKISIPGKGERLAHVKSPEGFYFPKLEG